MKNSTALSFKKIDILIPVLALIISLAVYFCMSSSVFAGKRGDTVIVTVDGREWGRFPLSEKRDIIISGYSGLNNHLLIDNCEADIVDAECPDKICVHQKKISHKGETIVCLPNRVVIEIEGTREGDVDAVSR